MKSVILLVALTATASFSLRAQTSYYWNASSGNWNNSANWSAGSPGASSNGKYPHSTDTVYIEGSSNATITLNVNDTIVNLIISGSGSFFINTSNSSVLYVLNNLTATNTNSSGGGTATIEMWGTSAQTITGGSTDGVGKLPNLTLANRSGGVTLYDDLTMGGSTTLTLASGTSATCNSSNLINFYYANTITGSWAFNNVEFQGTNTTFTISNNVTVNGNLKTSGSSSCALNSSTISLNGNLLVYNSCSGAGGGSTVISLTGSSNQQIYSNSTTEGVGLLPVVRINKTADSLSLQGVISIQGEWSNYYSTSKVNCGTAEFCFYNPNLTATIGGTYPTPIYRLAFGYIGAPSNATYNLTCDSALIVMDSTKLQGNQLCTINNHSIKANGNIIVRNGWGGSGTSTFFIGGSSSQSLISKVVLGGGGLPGITILKTGGSLSLYGIITVGGSWINSFSNSGVIAGSSTMYLFLANGSLTVGGTHPTTFYNLTLGGGSNCTYNFNEDSALIVTDTFLTTTSGHNLIMNNDSIFVRGAVINTGTGASGNTALTLTGSGNQIISAPSTLSWFPSITIHKGGGTVSLLGQIGVWTNWINNYSKAGIIPGTATLYFGIPSSTSTSTWGGSAPTPVYKIVLENGNCTFNLTHDSAFIVLDTLLISSGTSSTYGMTGNALVIEGNVVNNKAYAPTFSNTWIFKGTNNQTISGANGLTLHNMTVNKYSGTVTLKQPVNISNLLTFSKGIIKDTLTELLTINNGASVTGASDSSYVAGDVKKIGNAAFKFPVGGNNHYRPLIMSAPSTTTDAFTAGYNYATPPSGTLGTGVTQLDSCENWYFNHASGSSTVKVGLHTTHSCFKFFSKYHLTVGYLNGTWTSGGGVSIGGDSIIVSSGLSNWGSGNSLTIAKTNPLVTATAANNASTCSGASTSVGGSSGTGSGGMGTLTYSWSPATGLSSTTAVNPTATPTSTITYVVTVTDTVGEYNTALTVVTVNPLPGNNTGGNKSVCVGSSTTIGAASSTGHTYSWSPSTGLSSTTASNPTASPTTTTTYTLTETITATGCSVLNSIVVTVNPLPGNNAGSNAAICNGASTSVGNSSTTGHTYNWSPSTGLSSSTVSNPTASPTITTSYSLTEVITTTGCSVSNNITVTVDSLPGNNAGSNRTICNGTNTNIGAASTAGHSYHWSPSTGLSSTTVSNPTAWPITSTTYTLTETITATGCSATNSVAVTVNPTPVANAGRDTSIYTGFGTVLGSSSGSYAYTYSWSPATGLSATNIAQPLATPTLNTTYTLTVTNSNACSSTSEVIVSIIRLPNLNVWGNYALLAADSIVTAGRSIHAFDNVGAMSGITLDSIFADTINPNGIGTVPQAITVMNAIKSYYRNYPIQTTVTTLNNQTLTNGIYYINGNTVLNNTLIFTGDTGAQSVIIISDSLFVDTGAFIVLKEGFRARRLIFIVGGDIIFNNAIATNGLFMADGNIEIKKNTIGLKSLQSGATIKILQSDRYYGIEDIVDPDVSFTENGVSTCNSLTSCQGKVRVRLEFIDSGKIVPDTTNGIHIIIPYGYGKVDTGSVIVPSGNWGKKTTASGFIFYNKTGTAFSYYNGDSIVFYLELNTCIVDSPSTLTLKFTGPGFSFSSLSCPTFQYPNDTGSIVFSINRPIVRFFYLNSAGNAYSQLIPLGSSRSLHNYDPGSQIKIRKNYITSQYETNHVKYEEIYRYYILFANSGITSHFYFSICAEKDVNIEEVDEVFEHTGTATYSRLEFTDTTFSINGGYRKYIEFGGTDFNSQVIRTYLDSSNHYLNAHQGDTINDYMLIREKVKLMPVTGICESISPTPDSLETHYKILIYCNDSVPSPLIGFTCKQDTTVRTPCNSNSEAETSLDVNCYGFSPALQISKVKITNDAGDTALISLCNDTSKLNYVIRIQNDTILTGGYASGNGFAVIHHVIIPFNTDYFTFDSIQINNLTLKDNWWAIKSADTSGYIYINFDSITKYTGESSLINEIPNHGDSLISTYIAGTDSTPCISGGANSPYNMLINGGICTIKLAGLKFHCNGDSGLLQNVNVSNSGQTFSIGGSPGGYNFFSIYYSFLCDLGSAFDSATNCYQSYTDSMYTIEGDGSVASVWDNGNQFQGFASPLSLGGNADLNIRTPDTVKFSYTCNTPGYPDPLAIYQQRGDTPTTKYPIFNCTTLFYAIVTFPDSVYKLTGAMVNGDTTRRFHQLTDTTWIVDYGMDNTLNVPNVSINLIINLDSCPVGVPSGYQKIGIEFRARCAQCTSSCESGCYSCYRAIGAASSYLYVHCQGGCCSLVSTSKVSVEEPIIFERSTLGWSTLHDYESGITPNVSKDSVESDRAYQCDIIHLEAKGSISDSIHSCGLHLSDSLKSVNFELDYKLPDGNPKNTIFNFVDADFAFVDSLDTSFHFHIKNIPTTWIDTDSHYTYYKPFTFYRIRITIPDTFFVDSMGETFKGLVTSHGFLIDLNAHFSVHEGTGASIGIGDNFIQYMRCQFTYTTAFHPGPDSTDNISCDTYGPQMHYLKLNYAIAHSVINPGDPLIVPPYTHELNNYLNNSHPVSSCVYRYIQYINVTGGMGINADFDKEFRPVVKWPGTLDVILSDAGGDDGGPYTLGDTDVQFLLGNIVTNTVSAYAIPGLSVTKGDSLNEYLISAPNGVIPAISKEGEYCEEGILLSFHITCSQFSNPPVFFEKSGHLCVSPYNDYDSSASNGCEACLYNDTSIFNCRTRCTDGNCDNCAYIQYGPSFPNDDDLKMTVTSSSNYSQTAIPNGVELNTTHNIITDITLTVLQKAGAKGSQIDYGWLYYTITDKNDGCTNSNISIPLNSLPVGMTQVYTNVYGTEGLFKMERITENGYRFNPTFIISCDSGAYCNRNSTTPIKVTLVYGYTCNGSKWDSISADNFSSYSCGMDTFVLELAPQAPNPQIELDDSGYAIITNTHCDEIQLTFHVDNTQTAEFTSPMVIVTPPGDWIYDMGNGESKITVNGITDAHPAPFPSNKWAVPDTVPFLNSNLFYYKLAFDYSSSGAHHSLPDTLNFDIKLRGVTPCGDTETYTNIITAILRDTACTITPFKITASNDTAVCSGSAVTLKVKCDTTANCGTTYTWSPKPFVTLNADTTEIKVTPDTTTTYTVSSKNANGYVATTQVVVWVGPKQSLTVTQPSYLHTCPLVPITITANGAETYTWSPSTGLSSTTGPNVAADPSVNTWYVVTGSNTYYDPISDAPLVCKRSDTTEVIMSTNCCNNIDPSLIFENISSSAFLDSMYDMGYQVTNTDLNRFNGIIVIKGTFTLNSDLRIWDCPQIKMGNDARIIVPSGYNLTIANSHLFVCDSMWDGIYTTDLPLFSPPATVTIANDTIEQSANGIVSDWGNPITVLGNDFRNCFRGIQINLNSNKNTASFFPLNPNAISIWSNTFEATGNYCLYSHLIDSTIHINTLGKRTEYGISAGISFAQLVIGFPIIYVNMTTYFEPNYFKNLNCGIYSNISTVTSNGNFFENIRPETYSVPVPAFGGVGIFATGGGTVNVNGYGTLTSDTTFNNCQFGIVAGGKVSANIKNNIMARNTLGIALVGGKSSLNNVAANSIINSTLGILSFEPDANSRITINNNYIAPATNVSNAIGISLSHTGVLMKSCAVTHNNIVLNAGGNYNAAIYLWNLKGGYIENNQVSVNGTVKYGINASGCHSTTIKSNKVTGQYGSPQSTHIDSSAQGIAYYEAGDVTNQVSCDTSANTYAGFETAYGEFQMRFETNNIGNHYKAGLYYNNTPAVGTVGLFIGSNWHSYGNTWDTDASDYTQYAALGTGLLYKIYVIDPPTNTEPPPIKVDGVIFNPIATSQLNSCESSISPLIGPLGYLVLGFYSGDSITYAGIALNYQYKRYLFEELADSGYTISGGSTDTLQHFFDTASIGNIGAFEAVADSMNAINLAGPFADSIANLQDYVAYLSDTELYNIDTTIADTAWVTEYYGTSEYYALLGTLNLVQNLIYQDDTIIQSLQRNLVTAYQSRVTSLITQNSSISTSVTYEENEQSVNDIYIRNFMQADSINVDTTDMNTLWSIANQCPDVGGIALLRARGIIAGLVPGTAWNDDSLCGTSGARIAKNIKPKSPVPAVHLYPNPTDNIVNIIIENNTEEGVLQMFDDMGVLILTQTISQNTGIVAINTLNLNSGNYIVRYTNDKINWVEKLAVIH